MDILRYFLFLWILWMKSGICSVEWSPASVTSSAICPSFIINGHVNSDCSREIGSNCTYVCDSGCSSSGDKLYCTYGNIWSRGNCTCYNSPVYQPTLSDLDIAGIVIGVLGSILVVSVCVTVWMKRRRRLMFQGGQHTNINMTARADELPHISSSNISTTATVPTISSTVMHYAKASNPPPPYSEIQIINPPAYDDINFALSGHNS